MGCVITYNNKIIAKGHNLTISDPTAHAEMIAIKKAVKILGIRYLSECDIYVTLEPCAMCATAISLAKIRRLYFGAVDEKFGGVIHGAKIFHQKNMYIPDYYYGFYEKECSDILQYFFRTLRIREKVKK